MNLYFDSQQIPNNFRGLKIFIQYMFLSFNNALHYDQLAHNS